MQTSHFTLRDPSQDYQLRKYLDIQMERALLELKVKIFLWRMGYVSAKE